MNKQIAEGNWIQLKGKIRETWGELTDDELEKTNGNIEQILGKVHEKYGHSIEESQKTINTWLSSINNKLS